ncbi:hypothetical protein Glove_470g7 [Diversispora epigaea]|uniref:Uncharacterized protein n=1 Tax=Diversispora epigaea TaxID=1348612 RepID=A0A397GRT3_9GLOM|nr:hypothetical protein Glove_470g7 [Diversispora epigaea]
MKEWYNIIPRKWVFLEADFTSYKRYIKLGYNINSGDDIESAIKNIAGTRVANLNPNRDNDKAKLGTITGISNYQEWTWPTDEENSGYIFARALPGIVLVDITNITNQEIVEIPTSHDSPRFFFSGWALKENEKNKIREPVKRMTAEIKRLLEIMFHSGTANPHQKLNAQQMHEELLRRVEIGEIEENEIPKVTTISNWITVFSRKWKKAMALRTLEENMNSENL